MDTTEMATTTSVSPPKKPATSRQNVLVAAAPVELDEAGAIELRSRVVRDQVANLATDKLDQLKRLHAECVQMIGEELYLEKKLTYVGYTKWTPPQHLLNRDKLDYLTIKVRNFVNLQT